MNVTHYYLTAYLVTQVVNVPIKCNYHEPETVMEPITYKMITLDLFTALIKKKNVLHIWKIECKEIKQQGGSGMSEMSSLIK